MMFKNKRSGRFLALLLTVCLLVGLVGVPAFAEEPPPEEIPIYLDRSYSFEERAADLVSRMTLEEKASQMISGWSPAIPRLGVGWYGWWNEALHGVSRLQRMQAGNATTIFNTTSYPISLSIGSSWDPELMYRVASEIGDEAREVTEDNNKSLTFWSPTVNLNRDPRWGRSDESFGEDPLLSAAIASQFVNGMEGKDMAGNLLDENGYQKTISTIKHYLGNNSENNRLNGSTNISERELREYYSYVYRLIVEQSDVSSVMASYNRVNEVPANLDAYIMDTLLRQTFGFDGYVTSDCDSVWIAYTGNGYDRDPTAQSGNGNGHGWRLPDTGEKITNLETIAWAINAGGDLECNAGYSGRGRGFDYAQLVPAAIEEQIVTPTGLFDENSLDTSLVRLFTARMKLGEFDDQQGVVSWYNQARDRIENNYGEDWVYSATNNSGSDPVTMTDERLDLVREAGTKTIVLLKNEPVEEQKLLPLNIPENGNYKVSVIGYFADPPSEGVNRNYMFLGGYSAHMDEKAYDKLITPYQGIKDAITAVNPDAEVNFVRGFTGTGSSSAANLKEIDEAAVTAAANESDLCIVYVGTDAGSADEQRDRIDGLNLPGAQEQLIKMVGDLNPKTVAVMETISPNDVNYYEDSVPAMLWSCYNGQLKGQSLADILMGNANPSARTSSLWFDSEDQLNNTKSYRLAPGEDVHSYAPHTQFAGAQENDTYSFGESYGRTYMYYDESLGGSVKYPFGYGLSYTDFAYSNLRVQGLDGNNADANATLKVLLDVTNTGSCDGEEVVQLYAATPGAPAELQMPIKRLAAFDKVAVAAGETVTVELDVNLEDLAYFDEETGKFTMYNGAYQLQVSKNSKEVALTQDFNVTGSLQPKVNVVTVKPNQEGDAEMDIPSRVVYQPGKEVNAQVTVAMNDDTLYGYVSKGNSTEIPENLTITHETNRPEVVEVVDGVIKTKEAGVATITTTVTDSLSGTSESCEFVVVVSNDNLAYASSIQVGGEELEDFNPYVYEYTVEVLEGANVADYAVAAVAGEESWNVELEQAAAIPGTAKVTVSNEHGPVTYTIQLQEQGAQNAQIVSAEATNGTITAVMNRWPDETPTLADFSAEIAIDAFQSTGLTLKGISTDAPNKTVVFTFDPVQPTQDEQQVSINIRYRDTPPVTIGYVVPPEDPGPVAVTGITVTGGATTMRRGNEMVLTAQVAPPNATNQNVIWSTSNKKVATVENGVVKAVGAGSVIITAKTEDGGYSQRIIIRVM